MHDAFIWADALAASDLVDQTPILFYVVPGLLATKRRGAVVIDLEAYLLAADGRGADFRSCVICLVDVRFFPFSSTWRNRIKLGVKTTQVVYSV